MGKWEDGGCHYTLDCKIHGGRSSGSFSPYRNLMIRPEISPEPDPVPIKRGWFTSLGAKIKAALVSVGFGCLAYLSDWQIAAAFLAFLLIVLLYRHRGVLLGLRREARARVYQKAVHMIATIGTFLSTTIGRSLLIAAGGLIGLWAFWNLHRRKGLDTMLAKLNGAQPSKPPSRRLRKLAVVLESSTANPTDRELLNDPDNRNNH